MLNSAVKAMIIAGFEAEKKDCTDGLGNTEFDTMLQYLVAVREAADEITVEMRKWDISPHYFEEAARLLGRPCL